MSNILFEWEKRQFPERTLESDEMLALIAFPVWANNVALQMYSLFDAQINSIEEVIPTRALQDER